MEQSCKTCRYYAPILSTAGECRRRAPVVIDTSTSDNWSVRSVYPPTGVDKWCGEYMPDETAKPVDATHYL